MPDVSVPSDSVPLEDARQTADMSNKANPGLEDGEKQSPTDLQEIQLQMNATTDEVRPVIIISIPRAFIIRRNMPARRRSAKSIRVQA